MSIDLILMSISCSIGLHQLLTVSLVAVDSLLLKLDFNAVKLNIGSLLLNAALTFDVGPLLSNHNCISSLRPVILL